MHFVDMNPLDCPCRERYGRCHIHDGRCVRHEPGDAVVKRVQEQRPIVIPMSVDGCSEGACCRSFERVPVDD
jgi:hypothetical protein